MGEAEQEGKYSAWGSHNVYGDEEGYPIPGVQGCARATVAAHQADVAHAWRGHAVQRRDVGNRHV